MQGASTSCTKTLHATRKVEEGKEEQLEKTDNTRGFTPQLISSPSKHTNHQDQNKNRKRRKTKTEKQKEEKQKNPKTQKHKAKMISLSCDVAGTAPAPASFTFPQMISMPCSFMTLLTYLKFSRGFFMLERADALFLILTAGQLLEEATSSLELQSGTDHCNQLPTIRVLPMSQSVWQC